MYINSTICMTFNCLSILSSCYSLLWGTRHILYGPLDTHCVQSRHLLKLLHFTKWHVRLRFLQICDFSCQSLVFIPLSTNFNPCLTKLATLLSKKESGHLPSSKCYPDLLRHNHYWFLNYLFVGRGGCMGTFFSLLIYQYVISFPSGTVFFFCCHMYVTTHPSILWCMAPHTLLYFDVWHHTPFFTLMYGTTHPSLLWCMAPHTLLYSDVWHHIPFFTLMYGTTYPSLLMYGTTHPSLLWCMAPHTLLYWCMAPHALLYFDVSPHTLLYWCMAPHTLLYFDVRHHTPFFTLM